MADTEPTPGIQSEAREIAEQAIVELEILLGIEQSLRIALQWMVRGRGNSHKLSTLRFHTWSFERHLARLRTLADHGGYLHLITEQSPHLAKNVAELKNERAELHSTLQTILVRLDHISHDDAAGIEHICADLGCLLDDLRKHGRKEGELRQHSFTQEEGGSG